MFRVMKCFEYTLECDCCDDITVLFTGDSAVIDGRVVIVHDLPTAIKAAHYHKKKCGLALCNDCFIQKCLSKE